MKTKQIEMSSKQDILYRLAEVGIDETSTESGRRLVKDWYDLKLLGHLKLREANFGELVLDGFYFYHSDLQTAYLENASLKQTNFSRANLDHADLKGANLFKAYLSNADLTRADLRGANFESAYLVDSTLQGAYIKDAVFKDAQLKGVDLKKCNLSPNRLITRPSPYSLPLLTGD